ncbi:MAG TPA: Gfo/Idh/MocA family oxidoreductase, partial [Trichocoleus sp.]
MTTRVRLAVLGLGRWGVHLLRNFLALPQAQVVAVVDPTGAALERAASQFELGPEVQQLKDWREILQIEGLEAVAIATPAA